MKNPFAGWTQEEIAKYVHDHIDDHKDPSHPMHEAHKSMERFKDHLRLVGHIGRLQYAWCRHEKVPWLESFWMKGEMVQRGVCPDCGIHLMELD